MKDYKELIRALRRCDMKQGCFNSNCKYSIGKYFCDMDKIHADVADALEELIRTRHDELNAAYRQGYDAAMPKRGEWIEENRRPRSSQFVCSECHRTAYDPQPTRDKAWRKRCRYAYCPNCGAKMMEVQE